MRKKEEEKGERESRVKRRKEVGKGERGSIEEEEEEKGKRKEEIDMLGLKVCWRFAYHLSYFVIRKKNTHTYTLLIHPQSSC